MTTLAIIGSGLVGRSLIYSLAKDQKHFEKITLFSSDKITSPCTLNSTAIAAPRGITEGHSDLGDALVDGFRILSEHVELDKPLGIEKIIQYNAATKKLESFIQRYPAAESQGKYLKNKTLMVEETAFMIDPATYIDWLLKEARVMEQYHLEEIDDLVTEVSQNERVHLKTLNGRSLSYDKVVFACGSYNRFWKELAPESVLKTSKPAQGSYFEFHHVNWNEPSFSLTLDGDNIVWNKGLNRLFVGSTTNDSIHYLAPMADLNGIYERLEKATTLILPDRSKGSVKVGLREKARKRSPYIVQKENMFFFGGLYKNAFTLTLKMSRNLSHQLL